MNRQRRQFLMTAGIAGALTRLWPDASAAAQSPTPEQARIDPNLPATATQGAWKNLRAVRERKVIDFHCHVWETATQATSRLGTGQTHDSGSYVDFSEQMRESMDAHGISVSALSPVFVGYDRYMNSRWREHPKRFVMMAGVQNIEPRPSIEQAAQLLRRQFKEGARGIGEGGFPSYEDPKELKPVMDVVQEFDVPVLFHTGWSALQTTPNLNYSAAWRGAERMGILAAHYPQAKLVLAHIGGRFDHLDGYEMLRVAFTFDNVYVETSKSTPTLITEAVRGLGAERVVFGSDWNRPQMKTYGPKHFRDVYQHWYNLNQIAAADITEDERDMILYRNAMRLLKIPGS